MQQRLQPRNFNRPLPQYTCHHHPIIGEEHPNSQEEEDAAVDAGAAGAAEEIGAATQRLHHSLRSRARTGRVASRHQEVEATFHHRQEASNKDVGSSRVTNLTRTNGTKIGISVLVVDMMCPHGTPAKHAQRSAAGQTIKKIMTAPITNSILQQGTNPAQERSIRRCYHNQGMSGVNDY